MTASSTKKAGPIKTDTFPLSRGSALRYVRGCYRKVFGKDSFFVILYGAHSVYGLLATEHNGLAVCWENEGVVLVTDHLCRASNPHANTGKKQMAEYRRIIAMRKSAFRDFVNAKTDTYKILMPPKPALAKAPTFRAAQFTPTEFATANDKASSLTALCRFICRGFNRLEWNKQLYNTCYQHLGHIAHYDAGGFYEAQFGDLNCQIKFLEYHRTRTIYGDPRFTWSDVERAFQVWLNSAGDSVLLSLERERRALKTRKPATP